MCAIYILVHVVTYKGVRSDEATASPVIAADTEGDDDNMEIDDDEVERDRCDPMEEDEDDDVKWRPAGSTSQGGRGNRGML